MSEMCLGCLGDVPRQVRDVMQRVWSLIKYSNIQWLLNYLITIWGIRIFVLKKKCYIGIWSYMVKQVMSIFCCVEEESCMQQDYGYLIYTYAKMEYLNIR